jgi:hypothetical protein
MSTNNHPLAQAIETHGGLDAFLEHHQQAKKGVRQKRKTDEVIETN